MGVGVGIGDRATKVDVGVVSSNVDVGGVCWLSKGSQQGLKGCFDLKTIVSITEKLYRHHLDRN